MSHDFVERLFSQRDPDGSKHFLKVVAPMVRYSKMPFRLLCYQWGADLCFTPMIIAEGFNKSEKARDSSFRSCSMDRPLVVQFAANDPVHFGLAARRVAPFADAVDLNCGCPQKWAMAEGMGASLVKQPQLIKEMVQAARNMSGLPTSIKIRVEDDRRRTVDLIRMVESAGVAWITVHGRTAKEFTKVPVHLDAIKLAKENASVPIIANGDCFMPADVLKIQSETGADGVMSARGILSNPALYAGYDSVPAQCVSDYMNLALEYDGVPFALHHYHLMCMLLTRCSAADRSQFHRLSSLSACAQFLQQRDMWTPSPFLFEQRTQYRRELDLEELMETAPPQYASLVNPFADILDDDLIAW